VSDSVTGPPSGKSGVTPAPFSPFSLFCPSFFSLFLTSLFRASCAIINVDPRNEKNGKERKGNSEESEESMWMKPFY
jgi:hypothetical protein